MHPPSHVRECKGGRCNVASNDRQQFELTTLDSIPFLIQCLSTVEMFAVYRGFYQVLVLLAIRALGKSKFVLCQVPSHNRRPESAVLYLVDYSSNVVPSIKESYLLKWLNFEMFGHGWRSHTRSYSYTFFSQAWIDIIDCIHFLQYTCSIYRYILKSKMEKMDPLNICFPVPGMKWYPMSSFWIRLSHWGVERKWLEVCETRSPIAWSL